MRRKESVPKTADDRALARLIEAETRMREMMRAAREEAARIVAEAEAAAAANRTGLEADLERERAAAVQRVHEEYAALVADAERRREAVISALDAAERTRLNELAEYVVESVLVGAPVRGEAT